MVKTEICRKVTGLNKPCQRTLIYSITELEGQYGVEVENVERSEKAIINSVTPDYVKIRSLIDLMATNYVTVITAKDIVEDWLVYSED